MPFFPVSSFQFQVSSFKFLSYEGFTHSIQIACCNRKERIVESNEFKSENQ